MAVEYRLAPEHSLQAGREDCLAAVRWLAKHGEELGIDPSRLAVGGDSAGGGIAALVAQECASAGPTLCAQLLVYPATDLAAAPLVPGGLMAGLLTSGWMDWFRAQIELSSDLSDPSASPGLTEDLTGVAPAIVLTAGFDPLRDEGLRYVYRLREHQVPVRLLHFPGQIHGFLTMDRVLAGGREALDRLGMQLSLAFERAFVPDIDAELPTGSATGISWLDPRQRVHELKVGAIVAREWLVGPKGARARPSRRRRRLAHDNYERDRS